MKKILLVTNVLTLIFLYFQSCETFSKANGSFNISKEPLYSSCYNCVVDDIHGETAAEFADVTGRYRTTHQKLYNAYVSNQFTSLTGWNSPYTVSAKGFKDARSCWYSVDTLKKFICLLEKFSEKVNLKPADLGVRFYYGNYTETYQRDVPSAIHHTLYLTPTYTTKDGAKIDFEARISAANGTITTLASLINRNDSIPYFNQPLFMIAGTTEQNKRKVAMTPSGSPEDNVSMNQGDLCPPSTDCNPTLDAIDVAEPDPHF